MNEDKLFCLGCVNLEPVQDFLESGNFFEGKLTLDPDDFARVQPQVIALCSHCSGPESKSFANIMNQSRVCLFQLAGARPSDRCKCATHEQNRPQSVESNSGWFHRRLHCVRNLPPQQNVGGH